MTDLLKPLEAVALLYSIVDYENPQKDDLGRFSEALHNLYRTHHTDIAAAVRDKQRMDWLADPENKVGNVQLPSECVMANLHSLRAAIDAAMAQEGAG